MHSSFALDLKVARRKAGLTQLDCAHLLDVHQTKVSQLELGKTLPTVTDLCTLSVIYGKSFESLFASLMAEVHHALGERLATIPDCPKGWLGHVNRTHSLNNLASRLNHPAYG